MKEPFGLILKIASTQPITNIALGDRIGSVITGQDGSWSLNYDDSEFLILTPTEKRPDLQLMVLAQTLEIR
jgi:hypothetical protein